MAMFLGLSDLFVGNRGDLKGKILLTRPAGDPKLNNPTTVDSMKVRKKHRTNGFPP